MARRRTSKRHRKSERGSSSTGPAWLHPIRFFRSRRRAALRAQFAHELRDELSEAANAGCYAYDPESFALIETESDTHFPLEAAFQRYIEAPRGDAADLLAEIRREILVKPIPRELERAKDQLRLEVHCRATHEIARLAGSVSLPVALPISDSLVVALMYEGPSGSHACSREVVDAWGCGTDAAIQAALDNARRLGPWMFDRGPDGLLVSHAGEQLGAALLRFDELLGEVQFRGEPVVMVPDAKLLLVADSADERCIAAMLKLAANCLAGRGLSGTALRRAHDEWRRYEPSDGALSVQLRALEIPFELRAFERQHRLLGALYARSDNAPQIVRAERGAGPVAYTFCSWTRPGDLLLPVTDRIQLPTLESGRSPMLTWSEAMAKMGDRVEATDLYPRRVKVRGLPSPDVLRSL